MVFYDFEVFKYDWLVVLIDIYAKKETVIINNPAELLQFYEAHKGDIWVGYNSRNYDQYILKAILCGFDPKKVNDWIILQDKPGYRFSSLFRDYPVINYDVMPNPPISLKALEAFMGHSIKETSVPFDINRPLTEEELAETVKYCRHDVEETVEVWLRRKEDEFDAQMSLVKAFNLPIGDIGRTKAQLSAKILGAVQRDHNDEFEIEIPKTLRIERYSSVLNFYKNPLNRDYSKTLALDVAGVPHVFAWGGLHGAIPKYSGEGWYINVDVASYYPSLMLEYGWISRNVKDPARYAEIYHTRLKLKAEKNPMQQPYKIVLNSTYGAKGETISVTAYDQLRYLKNKDTIVDEGLKASDLLKRIATDFRLNLGTVEDTGFTIEVIDEQNQTLFDMIQNALNETLTNTKNLFVLYDDAGSLTLKNINSMRVPLLIDAETAENFDYTSSIDEQTYNKIKLTFENEKTGKRELYVAQDGAKMNLWGVLQYYEEVKTSTGAAAKAEALLKLYDQKTRNLTIKNAFGDVRVRAGCAVMVSLNLGDIIANQWLAVEKVTHNFKDETHYMDVTLIGGEFIA